MKKNINSILISFSLVLLVSACTAHKKVSYLKNAGSETIQQTSAVEATIFPNDLITIIINTNTPEASAAFNLPLSPTQVIGNSVSLNSAVGLQAYLVSTEGTIDFPILGRLAVAGKTKKELELMIKEKIYPQYITEEPIVHIRFANYKVSVLGEVARPGNFTVNNEKISIFDALAMAGDMTIYGKRSNVLILREKQDGAKETIRVNLQDKKLLQSPYYYLQQNDVVYVEPNKHKGNASAISSGETLSISITSTLISLTSLLITILK